MRIFITGCKGQLGRTLNDVLAGEVLAGCDLPELDIVDRAAIGAAIAGFAPDVVIHAAAWTDVDGCARDPERAYRVNGLGTQNVALACAQVGAPMVYISTNEVFDGEAAEPYREWDPIHPINPYGRSKAAGEWFVRHLLTRFYIVRTAWLYAPGGRNFPHRIIQLADERGALRVVTDEVGNPTYAPDLAQALAALIRTGAYGVYHLTNAGHCSRYDFAREILRITGREQVPVEPIPLAEFQRASAPPPFAPLANTAGAALGIALRPWEEALAEFLGQ
ncbi:MAG TPA: dTDP-4-dehydrorhamnose reductase [Anaerolineales bacterium]|nr:dTDP-4-dehydrorhamnose reductase [Anaerolineae bacterium]HIQ02492.1 dTDP-4-dehydrorhamnose reductase [Anaerolineales bacterium]